MSPRLPHSPLKQFLVDNGGPQQRWIAERTGIHESVLSRIVAGMEPGQDKARAIAEVLGRTCADLGWPHHDPDLEAAA
jgi:hypothetical protein